MMSEPDSTQEHCSIQHLASVFGRCQDEIVDEWRVHTKTLLSALKLDHATLTDHVPNIVAEIISDLSHWRGVVPPSETTRDSHPQHGLQRVIDGLAIGHVVAEYNLLRDAFFTVAERHDLYLVGEAARIISRRIDNGVRAAVTAFAAQHARNLKAREDEHLAFIAHDLRTPINAVGLLADEMKVCYEEGAVADADEMFRLLKRNLERLNTQIGRVLEGHSPGEGTQVSFQPECRTFELWPLAQSLILDFRSIAEKNGIEVVNRIPRLLTVTADAELISSALQNLLGNAFHHTREGRIELDATTGSETVTCQIADTGTGIPSELLTSVFDKHVTSSKQAGSGLGLAIVKQIIEAHGGTVNVESEPRVRTTFSFTLPILPV